MRNSEPPAHIAEQFPHTKRRVIAVDFDGTCVTHEYPDVGRDIGAAPVLRELVAVGHSLILWTMRSGKELQDAVKWFEENEIPLFGVNENPDQRSWTESKKAYAKLYIDDAALGVPLLTKPVDDNDEDNSGRPYVDWTTVRHLLRHEGFLK